MYLQYYMSHAIKTHIRILFFFYSFSSPCSSSRFGFRHFLSWSVTLLFLQKHFCWIFCDFIFIFYFYGFYLTFIVFCVLILCFSICWCFIKLESIWLCCCFFVLFFNKKEYEIYYNSNSVYVCENTISTNRSLCYRPAVSNIWLWRPENSLKDPAKFSLWFVLKCGPHGVSL